MKDTAKKYFVEDVYSSTYSNRKYFSDYSVALDEFVYRCQKNLKERYSDADYISDGVFEYKCNLCAYKSSDLNKYSNNITSATVLHSYPADLNTVDNPWKYLDKLQD